MGPACFDGPASKVTLYRITGLSLLALRPVGVRALDANPILEDPHCHRQQDLSASLLQ